LNVRLNGNLKHKITGQRRDETVVIEITRLKEKNYLKKMIIDFVDNFIKYNDKFMKNKYEKMKEEIKKQNEQLVVFEKYFKGDN
jgi:hypothetical protein